MANKVLGLGTLVKVDDDDSGSTFTTITLVLNCTPPGRKRERIDGTSLSDTLATYEGGIETHSEFTFTQFWEAEDTNHAIMDTLFALGSATTGKVLWTVTYSNTASSGTVDQFEGWVSDLDPQTITVNGINQRNVTIQRTGAITRT